MNRGAPGKSSKESSQQQQQSFDDKSYLAKRLKGSNSNNKAGDTTNNAKQSESSRNKPLGVVKKSGNTGTVVSKSAKSHKLRSPSKLKPLSSSSSYHQPRLIPYPHQKPEKRIHGDSKPKSTMKVQQQDSGETLTHSKKKEGKSKSKPEETPPEVKEVPPSSDTNGKSSESLQDSSNNGVEEVKNGNEPKEIIISENESSASEIIDLVEICVEEPVIIELDQKPPEEAENASQEQKPSESDANQAESVVESTTQEADGKSDGKTAEKTEEALKPEDDPSFINYDSSIMLKDVQIKLNDCLKENSKLMDVTDPNASVSDAFKDLSFGRTLRNISGRTSLGRMRHVTLRERQLTPNDSLFVNTSFLQDEGLNFFADSPQRNGTPLKRKLTTEASESTKKPKREETSIFNSSLEYIKNLRRPVQVSTPNPKGYKFDLDEKTKEDNKNVQTEVDPSAEPKKWCILM